MQSVPHACPKSLSSWEKFFFRHAKFFLFFFWQETKCEATVPCGAVSAYFDAMSLSKVFQTHFPSLPSPRNVACRCITDARRAVSKRLRMTSFWTQSEKVNTFEKRAFAI